MQRDLKSAVLVLALETDSRGLCRLYLTATTCFQKFDIQMNAASLQLKLFSLGNSDFTHTQS